MADQYAHECRIRDAYSQRLREFRPKERMLNTEHPYANGRLRADLRTIDDEGVRRIWEFKISAGYGALGQILTYLAQARKDALFESTVRGVLAAFHFHQEVWTTVEVLNLGIELVVIPEKLSMAGGVLSPPTGFRAPQIPKLPPASP